MPGLLAWRLIRRPVSSLHSISYEGSRYDTAPLRVSFAPPKTARFINQLFGASAGAAGAVIFLFMWWAEALAWCAAVRAWRRVWRLCEPLVM
jgi:hypothetical protein